MNVLTVEASTVPTSDLPQLPPAKSTKGDGTPPPPRQEPHYQAEKVDALYRGRPLKVLFRFLAIALPLLSFFLGIWWDKATGFLQKNEGNRATQLLKILTKLGPAYIKIGQALSTRPDLVPPLYLERLTELQDQIPPFSNKIAFRFIEEELGAPPSELYAEFSDRPLAAASLGQVYKGKLKTGETVAVKVQRPGLTEQITLDVYIMRRLALAVQKLANLRSDLVAITDEFAGRIFEEMDYTQEGLNAERFANLYSYLPDIYVPGIYWNYTGRRVLTMEWIDGTKLTNLEEISAQGIDAKHLIEVGVQCSLRQLLEFGFFHADPHPGNLLATPSGKLAYLDFGMMSEVKDYQRYGLIEAVVHMVNRDFDSLAEDYVTLEFLTPDTYLPPIAAALSTVFSNALGASVADLNFKSITDQLSGVMYEFPFRVPAYYALIIRSLVTLEGIAINVDPEFKVLSKAYPYIAKRLLVDPAPELRASLQALLFQDDRFRWNRLENLLNNAKDSMDYDLNQGLDQAVEFLYSERGAFIREQLVEKLVEAIEASGKNAWQNFVAQWGQRLGLGVDRPVPITVKSTTSPQETLERVQRIWAIVQDTPGMDGMRLAQLGAQLLIKPETQQMGQRIAGELAQRALARFIREVVLKDAAESHSVPLEPTVAAVRSR
ncbi:MAG: ABC1 kinase family protein [Cyanophyceae cyanobacterium]